MLDTPVSMSRSHQDVRNVNKGAALATRFERGGVAPSVSPRLSLSLQPADAPAGLCLFSATAFMIRVHPVRPVAVDQSLCTRSRAAETNERTHRNEWRLHARTGSALRTETSQQRIRAVGARTPFSSRSSYRRRCAVPLEGLSCRGVRTQGARVTAQITLAVPASTHST